MSNDEDAAQSLLGRAQQARPTVHASGTQAGLVVGLLGGALLALLLLDLPSGAVPVPKENNGGTRPANNGGGARSVAPRRAAEVPTTVENDWTRGYETPLRHPSEATQTRRHGFWRDTPPKPKTTPAAPAAATTAQQHAGFALIGEGHVAGNDLPGAPQPGNVTEAACAALCRRVAGCASFAFFPEPMWSSVTECYLKSSCLDGVGLDDVGGGTRTWRQLSSCQRSSTRL